MGAFDEEADAGACFLGGCGLQDTPQCIGPVLQLANGYGRFTLDDRNTDAVVEDFKREFQGKRILFCEDLLEVFVVPSCAFYSAFDSSAVCGLPTNQVHR